LIHGEALPDWSRGAFFDVTSSFGTVAMVVGMRAINKTATGRGECEKGYVCIAEKKNDVKPSREMSVSELDPVQ
jgi:hypothetical protein